ncbi:hypothetical protein NDU88_003517 [Pleurodeles waltl]|uniref:Uncharacterized protein n=1 Tax=Pleurodeles waltl TaxID=8319 RepID=A0AAV7LHA7_PLEWA|nr:hypothetical protein NDU88_003517 [Pleurodeles waltl]
MSQSHKITGVATESAVTKVGCTTLQLTSSCDCQRMQQRRAYIDGGVIEPRRGPRIQTWAVSQASGSGVISEVVRTTERKICKQI